VWLRVKGVGEAGLSVDVDNIEFREAQAPPDITNGRFEGAVLKER